MKLIYIAGKFTGSNAWDIEQNIRHAEKESLFVWQLGHIGVCPHSMNRFFFGSFPEEFALEATLKIMKKCDAIYAIYGYTQSKGAIAETIEAARIGMPILLSRQMVCEYLGEKYYEF
jgi:hypothetical protein